MVIALTRAQLGFERKSSVMDSVSNYRRLFLQSLAAASVGAVLVVVCYFFVDRPVAFFVHDYQLARHEWLRWLTFPEPVFQLWSPALLVVLAAWSAFRPARHWRQAMLALAIAVVLADQFKESLKLPSGRLWPDTWIHDNPSLIRDGAYGFFPFHDGEGYASFPSGHTARAFAAVAVLWLAYPRGRWAWVLGGMVLAASLVAMNYHFVGDVIAGGVIGSIVGAYVAFGCGAIKST
jgi:membrane-associated phospholipid phosphatase